MKLIIFGNARHGKDTACEYLRDRYGLSFSASSTFACETFLFEQLRGPFGYASMQECFDDRVNHRQLWYEAIRGHNTPDRTRLGRGIFAANDVYCGIRDREEFESLRAARLFDLAVWIDAEKRLPPESEQSMKLTRQDADLVISNNDDLEALHKRLDALMEGMDMFRHLCSVSRARAALVA